MSDQGQPPKLVKSREGALLSGWAQGGTPPAEARADQRVAAVVGLDTCSIWCGCFLHCSKTVKAYSISFSLSQILRKMNPQRRKLSFR